jgi:hypothetical protein
MRKTAAWANDKRNQAKSAAILVQPAIDLNGNANASKCRPVPR